MTTNQASNNNLLTNSYISEDWNGGYKLEVDFTAESNVTDWTFDFDLSSNYNIRGVYGVDLIDNGNGKYSISGQGEANDLEAGETAKAIFIIDGNEQEAIVPQFKPATSDSLTANDDVLTNSYISEDWNGGYKLEVDFTAENNATDWTFDFDLSSNYNIRGVYGVDLIDNGNGKYSISGQGEANDLEAGETAKAIFIIDGNEQKAIIPQFNLSTSDSLTANDDNLMGSIVSEPLPAAPAQLSDNAIADDDLQEAPPASDSLTANDDNLMGSIVSETLSAAPAQLSGNAITVGFENHGNNTIYDYSAQAKDWDVAWSNQMDKYASISTEEARSGSNSLKMDYPANEQSNAGAKWQIPGQQEYYLSYWVKFEDNFDFDGNRYSGGKLPGLGAGELASGGVRPNGNNGFTSRYMWREGGQATVYLYHMDMAGTWGDDILLKDSAGNNKYFEPGQWHNMVQRVKVNDGGQANGELEVWMDNEQVLDMDGLRFTNGQGIDTMYFSSFHGGNGSDWWPEQEVNAYFDDFVVSTNAADVGL